MDWDKFTNFLLSSIPSAKKASGGKVINCRCMECPDSRDPKSAHFYISIPRDNKKPVLYYCHKCGCSGIVTYKSLIAWNIYNQEIATDLIAYNRSLMNDRYASEYFYNPVYNIMNTYTKIDAKSEEKQNINDELKTSETILPEEEATSNPPDQDNVIPFD